MAGTRRRVVSGCLGFGGKVFSGCALADCSAVIADEFGGVFRDHLECLTGATLSFFFLGNLFLTIANFQIAVAIHNHLLWQIIHFFPLPSMFRMVADGLLLLLGPASHFNKVRVNQLLF